MKEKVYTLSVDVDVKKEDDPKSKRWYTLKIYGHPISANSKAIKEFELSNMRDEQTLKVGKAVLDSIWALVEKDDDFWKK